MKSTNPIVYLTRRATFCAAHRLHSEELSVAENKKIFGKCNNSNGHGHNYALEVTIGGAVDPKTGMVMNLVDLAEAIEKEVVVPMDHKHLNLDVPAFRKLNPTAENMVIVIWQLLKKKLGKCLIEVRLQETENNVAVYRG